MTNYDRDFMDEKYYAMNNALTMLKIEQEADCVDKSIEIACLKAAIAEYNEFCEW